MKPQLTTRVWRQTFGPIESAAGAVWSGDVLKCRHGHLQRPFERDRDFLSDPCLSFGCREFAFAEPSPVGFRYLEGVRIYSGPRKWSASCPTCGADFGEPCRATGRVGSVGQAMGSTHAARKRRTHSEDPRKRVGRKRRARRARRC